MFVTQAFCKYQERSRNRTSNVSLQSVDSFTKRVGSLAKTSMSKFKQLDQKHKSMHRTFQKPLKKRKMQFTNPITEWKDQSQHRNLEGLKKWQKIMDLYNMPKVEHVGPIQPGLSFYKLIANEEYLQKFPLKINFPQTILEQEGEQKMIQTNAKTGFIQVKKLKGDGYLTMMKKVLENELQKLRNFPSKYKKRFDFQQNAYAPVIITKIADDRQIKFQIDVESYKNFTEWRSRPTSSKIVQRYIWPRNMKAMIFRLCYCKKNQQGNKDQFSGFRFQNVDELLRQNKKYPQIWETLTIHATISINRQRENKVQVSKVTNVNGLQKFITPAKQLMNFIERSNKIKIAQIYIDFVVDMYDQPWVINLKYIQSQKFTPFSRDNSLYVGNEGMCKLCSNTYFRQELNRTISNKMLMGFLNHLKKRMRSQQYKKICFVRDIIKTHTKNHITFQVCEKCYEVVAEEFKLIECEQKLASLCNIQTHNQNCTLMEEYSRVNSSANQFIQWRVMVYLSSINHLPAQFIKNNHQVFIKSRIGPSDGEQQIWKINTSANSFTSSFISQNSYELNVSKLKVYYIYSKTMNIKDFLKETELQLEIFSPFQAQPFAKGSAAIFNNFTNNIQPNAGARQTSSVLLFYDNGKYCEITAKVGLVCDGTYQIPTHSKLTGWKRVYFADRSFTNSNPFPKQWMQIFGVNYETHMERNGECEVSKSETFDEFITMVLKQDEEKKKGFWKRKKNVKYF